MWSRLLPYRTDDGGRTMRDRRGGGLLAQLRRPPGGRDGRTMLLAQFLDRLGTGVWAAASVLYFTFVSRLDAGQVGLLLGVAAVVGIAGSPLAGQLAQRYSARYLLIWCHLLRIGTMLLLLVCRNYAALLAVMAVTCLAERGAKTLEILFATRATDGQRATYQALARTAMNAGYAVGAGLAAIGLAVGTADAYRALVLANALSFAVTAVLVRRTGEQRAAGPAAPAAPRAAARGASPWRDRGYLRFVLLDVPMSLDDSVLGVGLPLWLITRTEAPHALAPAFLVLNTVLVVVCQLRISHWAEGVRRATAAVTLNGLAMLLACALIAFGTGGGPWSASAALLLAAFLVSGAELMRSVSSWELAVSLAPEESRASYLGAAGMAQSVQKSLGPLLLTGAVLTTGPLGWLALGAGIAGLSVLQRKGCEERLAAMAASRHQVVPTPVALAGSSPRQ
ncbi:MFS transporter [Kitasatospora sp. NPDC002040]|uniref:MFS transporter n=1 Tax=Kitasatospora sp. NPDC002040 TaxID=3154661 RepID=UPI003331A83C